MAAGKVLASYDNNQAGQLAAIEGDDLALERRGLGDAANVVDTALGYLLGAEQEITVRRQGTPLRAIPDLDFLCRSTCVDPYRHPHVTPSGGSRGTSRGHAGDGRTRKDQGSWRRVRTVKRI
ncbi:hypothetical protein [Streptomyces boluensis]|uniref:Uncharacterized protein n=1 Tax=Streptomyces boluensis TaxID=1775135 RepID=A0A964UTF6_9ACTN|nr:hypothetical protein [Streptomyces boluensis]NBE53833.1 hypothetical protein [Streptomyces boluensis]